MISDNTKAEVKCHDQIQETILLFGTAFLKVLLGYLHRALVAEEKVLNIIVI